MLKKNLSKLPQFLELHLKSLPSKSNSKSNVQQSKSYPIHSLLCLIPTILLIYSTLVDHWHPSTLNFILKILVLIKKNLAFQITMSIIYGLVCSFKITNITTCTSICGQVWPLTCALIWKLEFSYSGCCFTILVLILRMLHHLFHTFN